MVSANGQNEHKKSSVLVNTFTSKVLKWTLPSLKFDGHLVKSINRCTSQKSETECGQCRFWSVYSLVNVFFLVCTIVRVNQLKESEVIPNCVLIDKNI